MNDVGVDYQRGMAGQSELRQQQRHLIKHADEVIHL